ncbi:MAG TPA: ricin-type beta-trefoil lectin domain protein [Streptosporangiaceae bacterium]|nr:ricin-type beta-trefoil lectin domain protein [Streptosporangiaceae bacterium]
MKRANVARLAIPAMAAITVTLTVTLTAGLPATAAAATLAPSKATAIVFVHGFSSSASTNCMSSNEFGAMIPQLQSDGFTGKMITAGYYWGDTNCSVSLHRYGSYRDGDPFTAIGKAFSWYVYDTFTKNGISVDAVGYSMGGLIVRAAIYGASIKAAGYSPPINVGRVATLGTPHDGAAWYATACVIVGWTQCAAMVQGSAQLTWLNQNGNPQGSAGTSWIVFGSQDDDVVPSSSAVFMSLPISRKIVFKHVSHTGFIFPDYMDAWSVVNLAGDSLGAVPGDIVSGVSSVKCIDDRGSVTSDGDPIQVYTCNGSGAQLWLHDSAGRKSTFSVLGKCLDDTGSGTANGTKIQLYRCNNSGAQRWTPGASGSLQIFGKCLDDPGSSTSNGTRPQIYTCNGTKAQRWIYG